MRWLSPFGLACGSLCLFGTVFAGQRPNQPKTGQPTGVVCDKFDVRAQLKGDKLALAVDTDLPDDTVLMVSVWRTYREKGDKDKYTIDYFSERGTVGRWRGTRTISVNNTEAMKRFEAKRNDLAKIGMAGEIEWISDRILVSFIVPVGQPNAAFGEMNKNLRGKMVVTSKLSRLRVVQWKKQLPYALRERPALRLKYADPQALKVGRTYRLSERTALMPEFQPADPLAAIPKMKYVPVDGRIRVISVRRKRGTPWYSVRAADAAGKVIGDGWVNSIALLGQDVEREAPSADVTEGERKRVVKPDAAPGAAKLPIVSGKVTLHLRNNETVTGPVFKSREDSITLQISPAALRTFKLDKIKRIEQDGRKLFEASPSRPKDAK